MEHNNFPIMHFFAISIQIIRRVEQIKSEEAANKDGKWGQTNT